MVERELLAKSTCLAAIIYGKKQLLFSLTKYILLADTSETLKILRDFESALLAINTNQLGIGAYPNPIKNSVHLDNSKDLYFDFF
jgi:hypothetical protein